MLKSFVRTKKYNEGLNSCNFQILLFLKLQNFICSFEQTILEPHKFQWENQCYHINLWCIHKYVYNFQQQMSSDQSNLLGAGNSI